MLSQCHQPQRSMQLDILPERRALEVLPRRTRYFQQITPEETLTTRATKMVPVSTIALRHRYHNAICQSMRLEMLRGMCCYSHNAQLKKRLRRQEFKSHVDIDKYYVIDEQYLVPAPSKEDASCTQLLRKKRQQK